MDFSDWATQPTLPTSFFFLRRRVVINKTASTIVDTPPAASPSHNKTVKLTVRIPQSWVRPEYRNPTGAMALAGGASCITDPITDHFTPYCGELRYSAINDIRVLDEC